MKFLFGMFLLLYAADIYSQHIEDYFSFSLKSAEISYSNQNILDMNDRLQTIKIGSFKKYISVSLYSLESELKIGVSENRFHFLLENNDSLKLDFESKPIEFYLHHSLKFNNFGLEYGFNLNLNSINSDISYYSSVSYFSGKFFESFKIGYWNNPLYTNLQMKYFGAKANFDQLNHLGVLNYNIKSVNYKKFVLELDYKMKLNENNESKVEYTQKTNSKYDDYTLRLFRKTDNTIFKYELNLVHFNSEINLNYNDLSFGDFSLKKIFWRQHSIDFEDQLTKNICLNMNLSYNRYEFEAVGAIESWPFFSLLESLIANRIYFKIKGNIDIVTAGINSDFQVDELSLSPGIKLVYVQPQVESKNWQPEFLLFGIKNLNYDKLNIDKIYLLDLSINSEFKMNSMSLMFSFSQLIPIRIIENNKKGVSSGGPSMPSGTAEILKKKTDGGREIKLTLIKYF